MSWPTRQLDPIFVSMKDALDAIEVIAICQQELHPDMPPTLKDALKRIEMIASRALDSVAQEI